MKIRVAENDSRKIYKAVTVSRLQRIQNIHINIPKFIIQNESDQNYNYTRTLTLLEPEVGDNAMFI